MNAWAALTIIVCVLIISASWCVVEVAKQQRNDESAPPDPKV